MNAIQAFTPFYAVEIVAPSYGTGYRIGGSLILTCKHLFKKNENTCKVRFREKFNYSDKKDIDAKVIWKAPDNIDIALIKLPETVDNCESVVFGNLPDANSAETIEFDFLGFPQFLRYSEDQIHYATGLHIKGIIKVADRAPNGHLLLNIIDQTIQPTDEQLNKLPSDQSPWQGTSGSAIICDGLVVGVQSKHPLRDRPQSLEAESLARVYDNQEWCEILTKHGINPQPVQVESNWLSDEEKRKAVKALLQEIESFHNKITLFHASEKVTLTDQYIPIQVTLERRYKDKLENIGSYAEAEAEVRRIYALKGSGEEEIKKTQEDWKTAKEKQNYIIVLADPGMGKSTLLRMEVCQTVKQSLRELNDGKALESLVIPLFIRLSSLADEEDLTIYEAILKRVKAQYSRLLQHQENETVSNFLNEFIEQKLKTGKCLLLLDALDEVALEKRIKLREKLNIFVSNYSCPIIATSRIVGYGGKLIDKGKEMEIVPFTQQQTEEYITIWFNNLRKVPFSKGDLGGSNDLIKALKERPQLSGLVQNPLLLSLICSLYQEDKLKLPARRGQIYEQAVDYMLSKWCVDNNRMASTEAEIETKKEILMELAYQFSKKGTEVFSIRILKQKIKDYLRRDNATDLDQQANQLITELSDKDGILQKLNQDKSDYLFLHRTFQEYFTALYLKYQIEEDEETGINLVKQYLWDYDWHETLIILAGLLDKPMVLIEAIRGEKDDIFKTQLMLAGRCLGECDAIKHPRIDEIIDGVFAWWKQHRNIEFFETVLIEIGRGYEKAVEGLLSALKDENSDVKRRAEEALGKIGSDKAVEGLLSALNDEDWNVRGSAAYALGEIGSLEAVEGLLSALNDEDWNVRGSAAYALGNIGSDKAVEGLLSALNDEDWDVRMSAAYALGKIGSLEAVEGLLSALNDENTDVRGSAAYALGEIGSLEAVEGLLSALKDENTDVRGRAAEALGNIGSDKAVEELLSALNDEDSYVRRSAAEALGNIGSDKAVEELVSALNDEYSDVRRSAAKALGNIGSDKAVEGLVSALNHEYSDVRWSAAKALEKIGSLTILEALIQSPDINLYDDHIFPVARRLAIKYSKSGASFIPVYEEHLPF